MFVARWYAWALLLLGVVGVVIGPVVAVTDDTGEGLRGTGFGLISLVVALLVLRYTKDKA